MLQRIKVFVRDSKAVSALEYAILVGVVAVALVGVMATFNTDMKASIDKIAGNVKTLTTNVGTASTSGG